jgi:hypothetical protein
MTLVVRTARLHPEATVGCLWQTLSIENMGIERSPFIFDERTIIFCELNHLP